MRRYDDERRRQPPRCCAGKPSRLQDIGKRLAAFHADAPPPRPPSTAAACRASVGATVSVLRTLLPGRALVLSREERLIRSLIDRSQAASSTDASGCGFVRDGHGDLRAEHVLLTRPLAIVDCIEFDAARRSIDVGADLARLKVDLVARGKPEMGDELVAAYRSAGGDAGDDRLLDLWCAKESLAARGSCSHATAERPSVGPRRCSTSPAASPIARSPPATERLVAVSRRATVAPRPTRLPTAAAYAAIDRSSTPHGPQAQMSSRRRCARSGDQRSESTRSSVSTATAASATWAAPSLPGCVQKSRASAASRRAALLGGVQLGGTHVAERLDHTAVGGGSVAGHAPEGPSPAPPCPQSRLPAVRVARAIAP